jgi:uncharacterized protein YndB with AHSA1/START domain
MAWMIESVREAPARPQDVFRLYADPGTWGEWGHNATRVQADGPLAEGSIVEVRANYGRAYPCVVRRFEPDRALELEVRPPLLSIINTYEIEPTATGSRVRHAFDVSGPLAGVTRVIGLPSFYRRLLDREVGRVIELAAPPAGSGGRDPGI